MHDCRDIKRHSPRHKTNERFSFSFNPSHTGKKETKHWLMNLSSPADARQFTASYREEGDPFWEIPINTTVNVLWCLPEGIINNNFLMFFSVLKRRNNEFSHQGARSVLWVAHWYYWKESLSRRRWYPPILSARTRPVVTTAGCATGTWSW